MHETWDWLTEEQAAAWLNIPVAAVRCAVQAGAIPALTIGEHIRISREALLTRGADPAPPRPPAAVPAVGEHVRIGREAALTRGADPAPPTAATRPAGDGRLPAPAGMTWVRDLVDAPAFTHGWPKKGGGTTDDAYPQAWQGTISLQGERMEVRIGECTRHDRGRLTVFFDRTPICEFVATTDGRAWASVIKPDGKRVLPAGEAPSPFYREARVAPYRAVTGMTGIGVPKGLAVVIGRDDRRGAVPQAAARWLGKRRFSVEPVA